MLTQTRLKEVLDYAPESGVLRWNARPVKGNAVIQRNINTWNQRYAGTQAGSIGVKGYRGISVDDRIYPAHRLVWLFVYGRWPEQIDHINGSRDDNRLINLRSVSSAENGRNRSICNLNKSGVIGVCWYAPHNKWVARIRADNRLKHLGYFDSLDEAASVRRAAEIEYGFHPNHGRSRGFQKREART